MDSQNEWYKPQTKAEKVFYLIAVLTLYAAAASFLPDHYGIFIGNRHH